MREGPLAALFRKTEEDAQEVEPEVTPLEDIPQREVPHPGLASQADDEPPTPTPQERLRNAFSSEIPESLMDAPEP
ncbi:MAG TPA: cell division protein FtsZ, partial [Solirubrobacteraceae bacterium]